MQLTRNDDSPPVYTQRRAIGVPQTKELRIARAASNKEVMTSVHFPRSDYVSAALYSHRHNQYLPTSTSFGSQLPDGEVNLLLNAVQHIVTVFSYYDVNPYPTTVSDGGCEGNVIMGMRCDSPKTNGEEIIYAGSGLLVGSVSGKYYIITARHNVLSTRKSTQNVNSNDLILTRLRFSFADTQTVNYACERHNKPTLPPNQRAPHMINKDDTWYHNSDFAVLLVTEKTIHLTNAPLILDLNAYPVPLQKDSRVYVIGVPGAMTEASYSEKYPGKSYQEFVDTFVTHQPNISIGSIVAVGESLCAYDPNTAGGMSGGPVFIFVGDKLVPIGLHVGGLNDKDLNYFVPFSMPQLLEDLRTLL